MNKLINNNRLRIIFAITIVSVMGVASLTPAFPKMADTLNLTKVQIGLLISAFAFPGIFLAPILGIIADRVGRKEILVPSLFLFAIAGFGIFFIHDFKIMVVLRVFQGIGAASLGALNTTLIGDFFEDEQRSVAMGYNASILSISTGVYPLVGGVLASFAWFYPFILPLLAIPIALLVFNDLPEPKIQKTANIKQYLKAISCNISKKEVIGVFVLGVFTFIILYGAFITYFPILLHQRFGFSSTLIGVIFSLTSIMAALVASQIGKLTNTFGSLTLLKVAFLLYFIVCMSIPFVHSIYFLILLVPLFGIAQALNMPSLQIILANIAPDEQRAAFMSLNGMVIRLGQTLGPIIIGIGYAVYSVQGAYFFASVIAIIGIIILLTMFSKLKST
ncbi:putative MFS family arabinose efflux permease [Tenacibaculum adriaticum]|uniref:Putative MFS family arabinose efflux permease n=1 Tax=Tenacibaculum adriaticum TaxID=413713 RepID=A0A5S5DW35_9FLAO|nr:MFS transporter [Tenacibaculum adriaticum]TYQ00191.1 putative MFS family arabinose efflux permease [Tenacibaculum adriaticum]